MKKSENLKKKFFQNTVGQKVFHNYCTVNLYTFYKYSIYGAKKIREQPTEQH